MEPKTLHGQCVAGGQCSFRCTNFKQSEPQVDHCKFCNHDISEHKVFALVHVDGSIYLIPDNQSAIVNTHDVNLTAVPNLVKKERMEQFTRAKIYTPNIAGNISSINTSTWHILLIRIQTIICRSQ